MPHEEREPMLSPADLAAELNVKLYTVYKWRRLGTGPIGHKVGGNVRFRRSDVDEWVASGRDNRTAAAS